MFVAGQYALLFSGNEDVPIAYYGESNTGKLKRVYREGLLIVMVVSCNVYAGISCTTTLLIRTSGLSWKATKANPIFQKLKNKRFNQTAILL